MNKVRTRIIGAVAAVALIAGLIVGGPKIAAAQADILSALLLQLETAVTSIGTIATNLGKSQNIPGYPSGATPLQGGSADVAAASAVATLTATTGQTAFICHWRCTATGSTAASVADITVAGPTTSEIYIMGFVAGVAAPNAPVDVSYSPCLPASAAATNITVTMGAGGSGAAHAACAAEGFKTATAP